MSKLFQLFIGNKNYSSWSMVAWLCLKSAEIEFEEIKIPLGIRGAKKQILEYSSAGFVPILKSNGITIHDSLAIAEYINEIKPNFLYPEGGGDRALCRSLIAEIHSGFKNFRSEAPMNIKNSYHNINFSKNAQHNITRIIKIFSEFLDLYGGPYLFGKYSFADIFFVQMIIRFKNYNISYPKELGDYFILMLRNKYVEEWIIDAKNEVEIIEIIDNLQKD